MIKKICIVMAALAVVVSLSCITGFGSDLGSNQVHAEKSNPVGKNAASQTAKNQYGGMITNVVQTKKDGNDIYTVTLENSDQGDINVDVGLYSGKIIDMQKVSSNNGKNDQSSTAEQEGGMLPQTASDYPLGVMAGAVITIAGAALLVFRKKHKTSHS